ncbi:Ribonuclease T2-like protein [Verticillium dahliae VDG1]|nr:Ribonuclease T2-like protein [Verticillium dahliae VDG1]
MAAKATPDNPVLIVGGGLAGLVAAYELSLRGIPTLIIDQESRQNLGGQAFWSLGGLFVVDSTEQRRLGIRDNKALAMRDWLGSAQFDREDEDYWPRKWAEAFVDFAAEKGDAGMEGYVKGLGLGFMFNVGWAERGDGRAEGHGNSVPRFHLTWGTGPEVVRVFREPLIVDETTGRAVGVRGPTS